MKLIEIVKKLMIIIILQKQILKEAFHMLEIMKEILDLEQIKNKIL